MISNAHIKFRKQRNFYVVSSGVVKYTEVVLARAQFMLDICDLDVPLSRLVCMHLCR